MELFQQEYPEGTLGDECLKYFEKYNISMDTRRPVKFSIQGNPPDETLSYIMMRYRQTHDILHLLLGQRTDYLGEATVKAFEAVQTRGLPMTIIGGSIAPLYRLSPKRRELYYNHYLPWAITTAKNSSNVYSIYWEK